MRVLITGASSGIGKALTLHAVALGYKVCIGARSNSKLLDVAAESANPAAVFVCKTDVSVAQDCQDLVQFAVEKMGGIDVLINNAGMSMRARFDQVNLTVLEQLMQVNFWGAVYCTKFALPYLIQSKGSVVAISSVAGFVGLPGRTGYAASKFALHGFMQALRIENRPNNLHVLVACPGFTASNIRKSALNAEGKPQAESPRNEQKMMKASEVASLVWSAIQKKKRFVTFGNQGKISLFLSRFWPSLLEKLTFNHMSKEAHSPFS